MGKYILKRIAVSILSLIAVMSITFFLIRIIPGGPFTDEKNIPPQVMENILARYKLNDPLYKQYADYLLNVLRFDFGPSFRYEGMSVNDIISQSFPISAEIGSLAIIISILFGIPIGVISAINRGKKIDKILSVISVMGITTPNFVIAIILTYIFILKLGIFKIGGSSGISGMVLPAVTLSGFPMAFISRIIRSSMLEVIERDYIKTARAKGMTENKVIYVHALKNALMPVLTYLGPIAAGVLTGSFVVEQLYAVHGIGTYFVTSIQDRDYTTIVGVTVLYSFILITFNLIVDICYAVIDSRIKLE
ncbi:MAG: ABC transporter permease [Clostridiaceae bacterium]